MNFFRVGYQYRQKNPFTGPMTVAAIQDGYVLYGFVGSPGRCSMQWEALKDIYPIEVGPREAVAAQALTLETPVLES